MILRVQAGLLHPVEDRVREGDLNIRIAVLRIAHADRIRRPVVGIHIVTHPRVVHAGQQRMADRAGGEIRLQLGIDGEGVQVPSERT